MKKILSLLVAALMLFSSVSALAADKEARQPDVFVNDALVEFADQNAYITNEGRTLVPARGVFEALGCEVGWDAENYVVTVAKAEEKKEIVLKIDDAEMKIVTDGKEETKTLEVPAQLMNNRTMIPLRAVSEALGCAIIWNEAEYTINISEMRQISNEEFNEKLQMLFNASQNKEKEEKEKEEAKANAPVVKISADEIEAKPGEEFEVYVEIEKLDPEYKINTFAVAFEFDRELIEYVTESAFFVNEKGEKVDASLFVENDEFENGAKASLVTMNAIGVNPSKPRVFMCKFKLLKDEDAKISLDDEVFDDGRFATQFSATTDGKTLISYNGDKLNVNTTEVAVKAVK